MRWNVGPSISAHFSVKLQQVSADVIRVKSFCVLPFALLLAALANAQSTTPTLTATPTTLTFSWQTGAALPAAQNITLKITPSGTPTYTVSTPPTDQWLIATPTAGNMPTPITVRVNPSTLGPGTYNSTVTITVTGVATPVTIPVSLNVTLRPGGAVVSPTSLPLAYPGNVTGSFTVVGSASALTFAATSSVPWLTISPSAGAVLPASSQVVTVTANPAALTPQTAAYTGSITVTMSSSGGTSKQTVAVALTVNSQTPGVTSFWPQQIPIGAPDTPVTIRGSNFYAQTTVTAAGATSSLKVTVISSDALLATVPAALLTAPGNVTLTVTNPAPGGPASPFSIPVGNTPTIAAICNAASYATGPISPGEIIAIFGQNIGPASPSLETITNGYVQGNTAGVDVQINGDDAPILYASSQQVTVQVPYTVQLGTQAAGTGATVSLTYGSNPAATMPIDVVAAAPGLFTLSATGSGQALVLNYNSSTSSYTVNSQSSPAHIGDIITFFLTGEGEYANASYSPETGYIVPVASSYPQLNPLPDVNIGGVSASNVSYAGPVPTSILGLLQINATVPSGATTGNAAPLIVTIGSAQTQSNVTMFVAP